MPSVLTHYGFNKELYNLLYSALSYARLVHIQDIIMTAESEGVALNLKRLFNQYIFEGQTMDSEYLITDFTNKMIVDNIGVMHAKLNTKFKGKEYIKLELIRNGNVVDELTLNEVWEQKLGVIKYHKTTHTFSCMYVPNQGVAISKHSHNQLVHNGKNIKKTRELYIFYVPSKILEKNSIDFL